MKIALGKKILDNLPQLLLVAAVVVFAAVFFVVSLGGIAAAALNADEKPKTDKNVVVSMDGWTHPLGGPHKWDTYASGRSHGMGAIDFPAAEGTPIHAAADGVVVLAGWDGDYGNAVTIEHPNGDGTHYAHFSRVLVKVGQQVKAGQVVGLAGNTGLSFGSHLHFEGRQGSPSGNNIVPSAKFLRERGVDPGSCYGGPCGLGG
ncbi:MAG: M23 family metallopeptidase [Canibacter sp.]